MNDLVKTIAVPMSSGNLGYVPGLYDLLDVEVLGQFTERWIIYKDEDISRAQNLIDFHEQLFGPEGHLFIQDPNDIVGGCKTCWEHIEEEVKEASE